MYTTSVPYTTSGTIYKLRYCIQLPVPYTTSGTVYNFRYRIHFPVPPYTTSGTVYIVQLPIPYTTSGTVYIFRYRIQLPPVLYTTSDTVYIFLYSGTVYNFRYRIPVLVAQLVERRPGLPMCSQKECPTKFETRWLQEIPFSKELTDNYCALRLQLRVWW